MPGPAAILVAPALLLAALAVERGDAGHPPRSAAVRHLGGQHPEPDNKEYELTRLKLELNDAWRQAQEQKLRLAQVEGEAPDGREELAGALAMVEARRQELGRLQERKRAIVDQRYFLMKEHETRSKDTANKIRDLADKVSRAKARRSLLDRGRQQLGQKLESARQNLTRVQLQLKESDALDQQLEKARPAAELQALSSRLQGLRQLVAEVGQLGERRQQGLRKYNATAADGERALGQARGQMEALRREQERQRAGRRQAYESYARADTGTQGQLAEKEQQLKLLTDRKAQLVQETQVLRGERDAVAKNMTDMAARQQAQMTEVSRLRRDTARLLERHRAVSERAKQHEHDKAQVLAQWRSDIDKLAGGAMEDIGSRPEQSETGLSEERRKQSETIQQLIAKKQQVEAQIAGMEKKLALTAVDLQRARQRTGQAAGSGGGLPAGRQAVQ